MEIKKLSVAVALVGAIGQAAHAVPLVHTVAATPFSPTEINRSFNLNLFDSNTGTLNSVMIELLGGAEQTLTAQNFRNTAQSAVVSATTKLTFTTSIAGLNALIGVPPQLVASASSAFSFPGVGFASVGPVTSNLTSGLIDVSALLGSFQASGGGLFNVQCTSLSTSNVVGGGGNIQGGSITDAGCGARVVYDYTPNNDVPEPASLALLGLALGGIGFAGRRARKV